MDPRLKPFEAEFRRAAIDNDEPRLREIIERAGLDWDEPLKVLRRC